MVRVNCKYKHHTCFIWAYKSPAHFMWTAIGFTEKLSIDFHHGHIVLSLKTITATVDGV